MDKRGVLKETYMKDYSSRLKKLRACGAQLKGISSNEYR